MLDVNLSGIKEVRKEFNDMAERARNAKTVLEIIGAKGFKDVIDHFAQEEDRDNKKWVGLKYTRKRGGSKILQDTGRLRASIRWRTVKDEAHIFTNVVYAGVHNFGYKKIPKREFMWVSNKAKDSMVISLLRWITRGIL